MMQRIVAKRAEVAIERAVLLHHHDDVLDALQTAIGYNVHRGRSRGCVALRVHGSDGVSGILRWVKQPRFRWAPLTAPTP